MSGSSSLFQGILTTNTVCVNNIEAMDGEDLTLQSEHNIVLNTPNLLINNLKIEKYIENYLFNETPPHQPVRHEKVISTVDKIDLTNAGTTSLKMLDAMKVTSLNSYTFDDSFTYNKNRQNYVNLKSSSSVNINVPVFNETTGDLIDYADVIYKNQNTGEENTLQNYIYKLVNFTTSKTRTYSPTSYFEHPDNVYDYDVTNMGEYFANTIETSNVSTFNIENFEGEVGGRVQPGLLIESESAINIMANDVFINGENINDIIKASLDETYYQFQVDIMPTNGLEISFTITNFTSMYDTFIYDVKFDIVDRDYPDVIVNTLTVTDIFSKIGSGPYTFNNLTEGAFYNIVSTVTNTFTGKNITNVNMSSNASGIVAIEIENFTININTTLNEANNSINFTFDQTAIQNGFDVDSDLNHDYDIVFTITQISDSSLTFNTQTINSIRKGVTPTSTYTFFGLNRGKTYQIIASSITNNVTSISVQNVYITDVYLPSIPTLTLSDSLTYNNTDRQFYVTITVADDNGGFSIQGTPTLTDAVYNETVGNDVFFTFNDGISEGLKTCNIEIIDNNDNVAGGPKTASNSKSYYLSITFANVPNVINLFQTRLLNYDNASVTTIESYEWKKNDSLIANETTASVTVNNENATYECTIIQINDEKTGFRRSLSASITITLPEITNYVNSFNITSLFTYTYQYTYNGYTYNNNYPHFNAEITINDNRPEDHIPFSTAGSKSCDVTINDPYDFFKKFNLGSFTVTNPTSVSGITFTNIEPHSITINWSNSGSDGTPSNTLEKIKVYYNTGGYVSNATGDYVGSKEASGTSSTSVTIENLLENTSYSFMIDKQYSEYGSVPTGIQTFHTEVKIQPSFNKIYVANNRIYWDINLGTASLVKIRYQRYNRNRTKIDSVKRYQIERDLYEYVYLLDTSTTHSKNTIRYNSNTGSQSIVGSQYIDESDKEFSRASITVETDSNHSNLNSGIFTIWQPLTYSDNIFNHINFHFNTYDTYINNRGTDNGKFAVITHDGEHSEHSVLIGVTPYFTWKEDISFSSRYLMGDLYSDEGFKSPFFEYSSAGEFEISELGIKHFVGNYISSSSYYTHLEKEFTNYLAIKNTSDFTGNTAKYGSAGQVYFKISNFTIDKFFTKLVWNLEQHLDKFIAPNHHNGDDDINTWEFPIYYNLYSSILYEEGLDSSRWVSMPYESLDLEFLTVDYISNLAKSKYTHIHVYRDRITSEYKTNLPLVTMWLDIESGDIPWNDGNPVPAIGPDTPEAIEIYGDRVVLSWNPNPNNHATLQSYKINMVNSDGSVIETRIHNSVNNRYTWTGLSVNTLYRFTVTKVTNIGELSSYPSPYLYQGTYDGTDTTVNWYDPQYDILRKEYLNPSITQAYPPSNGILEVTTLFLETYAAPPNSLSGTASTTSVSLSWNAGSHNDETFLSYTINREEAGGTIIASVQGITGTSYTWIDLDAGQQYYFTVQKVTDRGFTAKSNQFSIYTNDIYGTNPGTPEMKSRNLKSVTFIWASGDIGSGTLVRHNLVRYNDSGGTSVHSRQESTGTYAGNISITWSEDLEASTNYYFRSEMIVNYSGINTTTTSANVFTFSYSKVFPSPAVMFHGGAFETSTISFDIGWRMESHGDYTLEKVVVHWVYHSYRESYEEDIWNIYGITTYTDWNYTKWYNYYSTQSEKRDIYPAELEAYATTRYDPLYPDGYEAPNTYTYVYRFMFNNTNNILSNYTYDIVVEKVYSDLNLSEYNYNGVNNIPVISRAFPYSTSWYLAFKGIELIYGTHTSTGSPRGIIITIDLTGLHDLEVITSITYTKHPLSFVEYHNSPWTEQHVITNPTRETTYSFTFLPNEYTLVNNTMYNLGAIVVTNDVNTYQRYINFVYTA